MRPIIMTALIMSILSPAAAHAWGEKMYTSYGSSSSASYKASSSNDDAASETSPAQPATGALKSVDGLDAEVDGPDADVGALQEK